MFRKIYELYPSLICFGLIVISPLASLAEPSECIQQPLRFKITKTLSRAVLGLTEGLVFEDGKLFESTGSIAGYGPSVLNAIDLHTGGVTQLIATPGQSFGEGLVKLGKYFYQLTYQDQFIYQYESDGTKKGTKLIRIFESPLQEGWGLTTDGNQLIASDGNAHLFFLNSETLKIEKTLRVFDQNGQGVMGMNELEYVNGQIYANIFPLNQVIRLDATTGCENGIADVSELADAQDCLHYPIACALDSVLNGIAYDAQSRHFFITGKSWPLVFVGQFY